MERVLAGLVQAEHVLRAMHQPPWVIDSLTTAHRLIADAQPATPTTTI